MDERGCAVSNRVRRRTLRTDRFSPTMEEHQLVVDEIEALAGELRTLIVAAGDRERDERLDAPWVRYHRTLRRYKRGECSPDDLIAAASDLRDRARDVIAPPPSETEGKS